MSFETAIRNASGAAVVDLSGDLILGRAPEVLRSAIADLVHKGDRRIVLNCRGLSHVDSAGLGEIMSSHASVQRQGGTIKLVGVRDRLATLLKLTGVDTVIESFPDESAALTSFVNTG